MEHGDVFRLSYEDLSHFTDNFDDSNYIGHFQFGKLYRGKIVQAEWTQNVLVKIWDLSEDYYYPDNHDRLMDEYILLRHEKLTNHPGMVKLYGYCFEGDHLGVVYDLDPLDSLFKLIPKDGFTWLQRIKVALGFASLLKFLHGVKSLRYKPFVVRNIDCAHIVVDKDYIPKLCDFGMVSGGIFPDRTTYIYGLRGSIGYIDVGACHYKEGEFQGKLDVYAFGVLLVNLISKRLYKAGDEYDDPAQVDVSYWAMRKFYEYNEACADQSKKRKGACANLGTQSETPIFSIVHSSLKREPSCERDDEQKISQLAIECTRGIPDKRPTMEKVVSSLLELEVVKKNKDYFSGVMDC